MIEVILTAGIRGLGALGERVRVKPGYARNFLFPKSMALLSNDGNATVFESRRQELEAQELQRQKDVQLLGKTIQDLPEPFVIKMRTSPEGKLYAAVSTREVLQMLKEEMNLSLKPSQLHLSETRLREVGTFEIFFDLDVNVHFSKKLRIESENIAASDIEAARATPEPKAEKEEASFEDLGPSEDEAQEA